MMNKAFDAAIIGGGLAGLSAAICLSQWGHRVVLAEKEGYPFHKVCGEYISMESWDFLSSTGLDLNAMNVPHIRRLMLTSASGKCFRQKLPLGGFGISRYQLDASLAAIARSAGAIILENTKVQNVERNDQFTLHADHPTEKKIEITSDVCCGAFGKKSNLDVKWNRNFTGKKNNDFVAVKYHVQTDWPSDTIGLHNFNGGYCGISAIEDKKFCLCYLVKTSVFKTCGSDITQLEKQVLCLNPFLREIFSKSVIVENFPVVISQISFEKKQSVENGMLMLGDAAGMIAPLAGNGMSMAMQSGKMAAQLMHQKLEKTISQLEMESNYSKLWQQHFSSRFFISKGIQHFFGRDLATDTFIQFINNFPTLATALIRRTHGTSY